ncbi:nitroreductase family protein [Agarilytica rhodophyticola]|uniref:nitroreductase family protein n=1 Tax=Agarilytica rhodophyticola TaxID=1737490 RepID=UPI000B342EBB|nr:nitroreductase family protein [Agarilytica rhodophyticola]
MQSNDIRQHLLNQMNWRYGTKGFDPEKKVAEEDLNAILDAMRLAPSSFGLQPWRFILVESASIRQQMAEAVPANKAKFENASHLIILARLNNLSQDYVDHYFNLVKQVRLQDHAAVKPFYDMVSNKGKTTPKDAINMWTAK